MLLDQKNQYCENDYTTTQSNLEIQFNPYQTTNGIFHRIRTKTYICMYVNTKDRAGERKTELEESGFLTSDYTAKLQ